MAPRAAFSDREKNELCRVNYWGADKEKKPQLRSEGMLQGDGGNVILGVSGPALLLSSSPSVVMASGRGGRLGK